jgi:hypothetical protein
MLLNLLRYDYWLDPLARWRLAALLAALVIAAVFAWRTRRQPIALGALRIAAHALLTLAALVNMPRFAPNGVIAALALGPLCAVALALSARNFEPLGRIARALAPFALGYAASLFSALRLDVSALGVVNGVLSPPVAWLVASGIAVARAARATCADDARFVRLGAATLVCASLAWAVYAAADMRSHGVTGSDPYAYAQMGVDLASTGTTAHAFPLVEQTYALDIPTYPVIHQGYKLPNDARRLAPTVWPIGYAWFTAVAWRFGGETALLWLTPLFNIASLIVVFAVMRRIARNAFGDAAAAVGALTVMITATSLLQVTWQMVVMADIAAQAFSWLALAFALGAASLRERRYTWLFAALSGAALGMAFNVRYTQVLIAPGLALALWQSRGARVSSIALCAGVALLTVLPTFAHHAAWFGSPLTTGSDELQHFAPANIAPMARALRDEFLAYREFGLLAPLLLAGVIAFARRDRAILGTLAAFALPVLVFHLFYGYLRARDLLSLIPLGALFAAAGIVWLWRVAQQHTHVWRAALVIAASFAFVLRGMETLALPAVGGFTIFGHLLREQRAALDTIATATPPDAIVGSTLNTGAIDLHAGRRSFRPADWQPDALHAFVMDQLVRGRAVFMLIDGDDMRAVEAALSTRFTLRDAGLLPMPYYQARGGGAENRDARLVRIERRP